MIGDAIEFVRKEVARHLGLDNADVTVSPARKLVEEAGSQGLSISVVNVQEEPALRNQPHSERRQNRTRYIEPPVHLNLFLLFAFEFQDYAASLAQLSKTVELFQKKRWFGPATQTGANAVAFPPKLEKLVFDMVNLDFEQLNNLWSVLGGSYFPSVVYKVRLVKIQADETVPAHEVLTTEVRTVRL